MPISLKRIEKGIFYVFLLLQLTCFSNLYANEPNLSLEKAEEIAVKNAPEIQRLYAQAQSLAEKSVAEGQLPDPKLVTGLVNVPTNTFSFTQDDMTMISFGLQQAFPPGKSLAFKSQQTKALSNAQLRKIEEQKINLLRSVRQSWLELYYWVHAIQVMKANEKLYKELLQATEVQYSANKGTQSDVLQVQLELSRLQDQIVQATQREKIARAQLKRWVGDRAECNIASSLPHWPAPLSLEILQKILEKHPVLKADAASIDAARLDVAWAREQCKPGWMLDVSYGIRRGHMTDGAERSDMVTANATIDLPLFTKNRQNRQVKSSAYQLEATQYDRHVHYKDLLEDLNVRYATWESLSQREVLYEGQLTVQAKQNAKAALLSYQSASADLTTVLRAYSNELTIYLEELQIKMERAKARAALLYYAGVSE